MEMILQSLVESRGFAGIPVTVIAQAKGKSTKENVAHHFGMPSPEGYRKALRLMKQAEKFKRPILLFVDTPGGILWYRGRRARAGRSHCKKPV